MDKEKQKEIAKKSKGFFAEFQKFIMRGNVIDLAVGVIIGSAFTAIVNSLVTDIFAKLEKSLWWEYEHDNPQNL